MNTTELIENYKKYNKSNKYELYFIYKKVLYKIIIKELNNNNIKITTESKSHGGQQKLRLYFNNKDKEQMLMNGATEVMNEQKFLDLAKTLKLNKGETCEYLAHKQRNLEYKRDNIRFDKAGDINLKRDKIQVKFENASIARISTIIKVASENN